MGDKLDTIFELRESFMKELRSFKKTSSPATWPLKLTNKKDQQVCRDIALRGVEEMFEALQHLKNWKPHRKTRVSSFDREEFLEEVVDAFNYFFSLLILTGVDQDEFFEAYKKKDKIIRERIKTGY